MAKYSAERRPKNVRQPEPDRNGTLCGGLEHLLRMAESPADPPLEERELPSRRDPHRSSLRRQPLPPAVSRRALPDPRAEGGGPRPRETRQWVRLPRDRAQRTAADRTSLH